jgi:hypothetical protein
MEGTIIKWNLSSAKGVGIFFLEISHLFFFRFFPWLLLDYHGEKLEKENSTGDLHQVLLHSSVMTLLLTIYHLALSN